MFHTIKSSSILIFTRIKLPANFMQLYKFYNDGKRHQSVFLLEWNKLWTSGMNGHFFPLASLWIYVKSGSSFIPFLILNRMVVSHWSNLDMESYSLTCQPKRKITTFQRSLQQGIENTARSGWVKTVQWCRPQRCGKSKKITNYNSTLTSLIQQ